MIRSASDKADIKKLSFAGTLRPSLAKFPMRGTSKTAVTTARVRCGPRPWPNYSNSPHLRPVELGAFRRVADTHGVTLPRITPMEVSDYPDAATAL
jgi:hypothetical protein